MTIASSAVDAMTRAIGPRSPGAESPLTCQSNPQYPLPYPGHRPSLLGFFLVIVFPVPTLGIFDFKSISLDPVPGLWCGLDLIGALLHRPHAKRVSPGRSAVTGIGDRDGRHDENARRVPPTCSPGTVDVESPGNTSLAFLKNSSLASGISEVSMSSSAIAAISAARFFEIGIKEFPFMFSCFSRAYDPCRPAPIGVDDTDYRHPIDEPITLSVLRSLRTISQRCFTRSDSSSIHAAG
jgi:hypothetical protein